ncbi:TPA: hypothetical protein ACLBZ1_005439 [Bacillus cereus]
MEPIKVQISNFEILVKDYITEDFDGGKMFITDSEIDASHFQAFLDFYENHRAKGNYFTTVFPNVSFHGRFGQIVFSEHNNICKLRLVFVQSQCEHTEEDSKFGRAFTESVVIDNAKYRNLVEKTIHQDIILEKLKTALENKGVFTSEELQQIFTIEESVVNDRGFELSTRVKDLDEYLKSIKDTLDDIRKQ